ncbi:MAG: LPS export ABC transporter ATP-binding protein [Elusimicrobiales bacterium]|nr:LPS export ABC transporter ATP-binding protein [Elusimicrobiales bacterium]
MELIAQNLTKRYGKKIVVNSITINLSLSEIVGLLGPNGSGKSTTFNMIMGFVKPDEGTVIFNSKEITHYPVYRRAEIGIGYLAQEPTVFRELTVEENIMVALEKRNYDKNTIKQKIDMILKEFSIDHLKKQKASTLSGGEKRRVEVARVMALEPSIILLDEPFVGIDPITISDLKKIITYLSRKNIGILISDHNVRETLQITTRAYLIYRGEIVVEGSSNEIINNEKAKRFYLGYDFEM